MDSSRPPRTTPRKNDAKKEVDTARRRAYLFFCCPFPWGVFRGRLSRGGSMMPAPVGDRARRPPPLDRPAPPTPRAAPGR